MAINGADAIRPLSPEIGVTATREVGARTLREPRADEHASRVAPHPERRVQLPDFTGHDLSFRHDEELNRVIVQVVDAKTREVVRTIPPEEIVNILKNIRRAQGALLDEEA